MVMKMEDRVIRRFDDVIDLLSKSKLLVKENEWKESFWNGIYEDENGKRFMYVDGRICYENDENHSGFVESINRWRYNDILDECTLLAGSDKLPNSRGGLYRDKYGEFVFALYDAIFDDPNSIVEMMKMFLPRDVAEKYLETSLDKMTAGKCDYCRPELDKCIGNSLYISKAVRWLHGRPRVYFYDADGVVAKWIQEHGDGSTEIPAAQFVQNHCVSEESTMKHEKNNIYFFDDYTAESFEECYGLKWL